MILCGKVAVNFFKHKGYTPIQSFIDQSASPTIEQADAIADYLVEYYLANELDEAFALYNHHHGILSQTPVEWRLMPIDMAAFDPHHVRFSGGIDVYKRQAMTSPPMPFLRASRSAITPLLVEMIAVPKPPRTRGNSSLPA